MNSGENLSQVKAKAKMRHGDTGTDEPTIFQSSAK